MMSNTQPRLDPGDYGYTADIAARAAEYTSDLARHRLSTEPADRAAAEAAARDAFRAFGMPEPAHFLWALSPVGRALAYCSLGPFCPPDSEKLARQILSRTQEPTLSEFERVRAAATKLSTDPDPRNIEIDEEIRPYNSFKGSGRLASCVLDKIQGGLENVTAVSRSISLGILRMFLSSENAEAVDPTLLKHVPPAFGTQAGWLNTVAFYDFMAGAGLAPEDRASEYDRAKNIMNALVRLLKACDSFTLLRPGIVLLSDRPAVLKLFGSRQLGCDGGPALMYRDGLSLWLLNGVSVPRWLAETGHRNIPARRIQELSNAEQRREFVRKVGVERICEELDAECIDEMDGYKLIVLTIGDGRRRPYLWMKNPSLGIWHAEGVLPDIKTVREALAWRYGEPEYIRPDILK